MLYMFGVLDKAVNAFMTPFFCRARGEAVRTFTDAVNEKGSPFYKHPADFELYYLGSFDPANGSLFATASERVVSSLDVVDKITDVGSYSAKYT